MQDINKLYAALFQLFQLVRTTRKHRGSQHVNAGVHSTAAVQLRRATWVAAGRRAFSHAVAQRHSTK